MPMCRLNGHTLAFVIALQGDIPVPRNIPITGFPVPFTVAKKPPNHVQDVRVFRTRVDRFPSYGHGFTAFA
jgi:hypothetical protein